MVSTIGPIQSNTVELSVEAPVVDTSVRFVAGTYDAQEFNIAYPTESVSVSYNVPVPIDLSEHPNAVLVVTLIGVRFTENATFALSSLDIDEDATLYPEDGYVIGTNGPNSSSTKTSAQIYVFPLPANLDSIATVTLQSYNPGDLFEDIRGVITFQVFENVGVVDGVSSTGGIPPLTSLGGFSALEGAAAVALVGSFSSTASSVISSAAQGDMTMQSNSVSTQLKDSNGSGSGRYWALGYREYDADGIGDSISLDGGTQMRPAVVVTLASSG